MVLDKVTDIFLPPALKEQAFVNLSLVAHQPRKLGKGLLTLVTGEGLLAPVSSFLCLLISAQARQEKAQLWKQQTWWETLSWRLCFLLCF